MAKLPEDYLYEYVIMCDDEEIASYYSDAVPPEVGSLINPWEFIPEEDRNVDRYKGPYIVASIDQHPKKLDDNPDHVSAQSFVYVVVEKSK